jgi:hypothetical protein
VSQVLDDVDAQPVDEGQLDAQGLCVHCGKPAGVIVDRTDPEGMRVFTLRVTNRAGQARRVCEPCFYARVDAVLADIVARVGL